MRRISRLGSILGALRLIELSKVLFFLTKSRVYISIVLLKIIALTSTIPIYIHVIKKKTL
jgi:hypothetical protein